MFKIRDWLYIGKFSTTCDRALLQAHQIGAMLQLADPVKQRGIESLFLRFEDGLPLNTHHIVDGVSFIRTQKAEGKHVLVACGAGISRSVSLAAAALKEEENLSLWDALGEIKLHHREALPHYAIWQSLLEYYPDEDATIPRAVLLEKLYFTE